VFLLPYELECWPVALPPRGNATVFVHHEVGLTSVSDAWHFLVACGATLASTHGIQPHDIILGESRSLLTFPIRRQKKKVIVNCNDLICDFFFFFPEKNQLPDSCASTTTKSRTGDQPRCRRRRVWVVRLPVRCTGVSSAWRIRRRACVSASRVWCTGTLSPVHRISHNFFPAGLRRLHHG
jgi:hypothetical protein